MQHGLVSGLSHRASIKVDDGLTVPGLVSSFAGFDTMPPVFATAMMIGFVESTCMDCMSTHLPDGLQTLGTYVCISHISPTPVGLIVTADVKLVDVNRRTLLFDVEVWDDYDSICIGSHERTVVDANQFLKRIQQKAEREIGACFDV